MTTGKPTDQAADSASDNTNRNADVTAAKPATVSSADLTNTGTGKETAKATAAKEYGGPQGLEPTRYGDWEKNGRCSDF